MAANCIGTAMEIDGGRLACIAGRCGCGLAAKKCDPVGAERTATAAVGVVVIVTIAGFPENQPSRFDCRGERAPASPGPGSPAATRSSWLMVGPGNCAGIGRLSAVKASAMIADDGMTATLS